MPSQGVFRKDIYHATVMIYDTKIISCTIGATYYATGQLESPEKKNAAQLTVMEKTLSSYCATTIRNAFLL